MSVKNTMAAADALTMIAALGAQCTYELLLGNVVQIALNPLSDGATILVTGTMTEAQLLSAAPGSYKVASIAIV